MGVSVRIEVTPGRIAEVKREIAAGSEPHVPFYVMAAVSTGLAAFGLAMNSTAVVIGAMLVAPLMTPIFGMALALVRGNPALLTRASKAVVAGVLVSVAVGAVLGFAMPGLEPTAEMLARTRPNLFDLAVAVLAGFAGAYALVDQKLSATLPGVAIAVALVPPLANTGLSLSLGAYQGAWGSFLLFFANFLSILLVASAIFAMAGLVPERSTLSRREITRRFGLAGAGFLIVAALLGNALVEMVRDRQTRDTIHAVLQNELQARQTTGLERLTHQRRGDTVYVLAHIYSPRVMTPNRVAKLENALALGLGRPAELFVRSTLSRDVSATGHTSQVATENLNGFFYASHVDDRVRLARHAEQVIRERLAAHVGIYLDELTVHVTDGTEWIVAFISGIRRLTPQEIAQIEDDIAADTEYRPNLTIIQEYSDVYDREGGLQIEFTAPFDTAVTRLTGVVARALRERFVADAFTVDGVTVSFHADTLHVLTELVGPRIVDADEVSLLRDMLSGATGQSVALYVRSRPEVVVTEAGPVSFDSLRRRFREMQSDDYPGFDAELREAIQ